MSSLWARRLGRKKTVLFVKGDEGPIDETVGGAGCFKLVQTPFDDSDAPAICSQHVRDTYEFKEKLGEGCSSTVWKAVRKSDKKLFAIKEYMRESNDVEIIGIAQREFLLLHELNHENIVKVEDLVIDPTDSKLYMVQEFCDGEVLEDILQERQRGLSEGEARNVMKQLLNAVFYLHSKQICHRDIKPSNVIVIGRSDRVSSDISLDRVVLLDFNTACEFKSSPIGMHDVLPGLSCSLDTQSLDVSSPSEMETASDTAAVVSGDVMLCSLPVSHPVVSDPDLCAQGAVFNHESGMMTPAGTRGYMAPEVDGHESKRADALALLIAKDPTRAFSYTEKVDVYSLGKVFAICSVTLSSVGLDLMHDMLLRDPLRRPTVSQCLLHSWVRPTDCVTSQDKSRLRKATRASTVAQRTNRRNKTARKAVDILLGASRPLDAFASATNSVTAEQHTEADPPSSGSTSHLPVRPAPQPCSCPQAASHSSITGSQYRGDESAAGMSVIPSIPRKSNNGSKRKGVNILGLVKASEV